MQEDEVSQVLKAKKTQELVYELRVEQAMKQNAITVKPDDTMDDVREILRDKKISGAPVAQGDELVGIISIEDLIKSLVRGETGHKVKDKMTTDVVTLCSDDLLVVAINRFDTFRYGRFPVIDRKTKKLVGILTKGDVIRCLLKRLELNHLEKEARRFKPHDLFEQIKADGSILVLRYFVEGSNFENAGERSSALKHDLRRLGFPPDITRRVTIACYEAEMNIVVFTAGGELVASIEPKRITVEAIDKGPGIADVSLAMQPGYSTAPDWVRELGFGAGMGLPNIKNCSDEMKLESRVGEGTNLRFSVLRGT